MNKLLHTDGMMTRSVAVEAPDFEAERLEQLIALYDDRRELDDLIKIYEGRRETLNAIVCAADKAAEDYVRGLTDDDDAAARAVGALVDETLMEICRLPVGSLAAIQRKAAWLRQLDEAHGELQERPDLLAAALASMTGVAGGAK